MFIDVVFLGLLGTAFVGWMLYRWLIRKDLHEHWDELRTGAFFLVGAGLVYWLLLR
jgi:hypothetical protein